MKPLLVGESNPYGSDPEYALFPNPGNSAGARLARILGMDVSAYLRAFDRVNLIPGMVCPCDRHRGGWCPPCARAAAKGLTAPFRVLLGARVTAAHGAQFHPFTTVEFGGGERRGWWLLLPHPSGRSRLWNDPVNTPRVRAAVSLIRDFARSAV